MGSQIEEAIALNLAHPGPYAAENLQEGEAGRFFDDYCNWQNFDVPSDIMAHSQGPEAAALLMQSEQVQFFHDHILVKEPGHSQSYPMASRCALLFC